ncbi:hypothetical protein AGLY_010318 [Aphis glycines]|uniref:Enoyl reductase (ER) domain-containing protein n=1 Tax=Aphis glycines TaxID=307491 RepID=A0A6G0TFM5_APHGL|nr:hypothetical protein AGLY_010318 [Aphis glycines]
MSKSNTIFSLVFRSFPISPSRNTFVARTIRRRTFTSSYSATADDMTVDIPTTDDKSGTTPTQTAWSSKMIAWQAHSYNTVDDLVLTSNARSPTMVEANEVLVRVKASSVNPLDVLMAEGFGQVLLGTIRQAQKMSLHKPVEFPLTLGRDFCGEIIAKGVKVKSFNVGDVVMGVVPPFQQGCHSEFVAVPAGLVAKKPDHLTNEEAAGLLYTGMTAWSALKLFGGLYVMKATNKNVLVIGGSGGVGNCAIQLLKHWGAKVTTTCDSTAINLVKSLGPDNIIDYTAKDAKQQLEEHGKYDIILDAAGISYNKIGSYTPLLKEWSYAAFITLRSPILHNTDSYGFVGGMFKNAIDLLIPNILSGAVFKGSTIRWGTFIPVECGVKELAKLAEEKKILIPLEKTFKFIDLKDAYKRVQEGHLRGKVVITFDKPSMDKARLTN